MYAYYQNKCKKIFKSIFIYIWALRQELNSIIVKI